MYKVDEWSDQMYSMYLIKLEKAKLMEACTSAHPMCWLLSTINVKKKNRSTEYVTAL